MGVGALAGIGLAYLLTRSLEPPYEPPYEPPPPDNPPTIAELISQVNETNIRNSTIALVNFYNRADPASTGPTQGNIQAGAWLKARLEAIPRLVVAYKNASQPSTKNVEGALIGDSKEYIVGAHYDCLPVTGAAPGASDNAVGCAMVLEMARIMAQYDFEHTVRFVFFNGEEGGQRGAHQYVAELTARNADVGFYYNVDSAGYDPNNENAIDVVTNSGSAFVANLFTKANSDQGLNFYLSYNHHSCASDHYPFWEHSDYPAMTTHSNGGTAGGHYPKAETASDVIGVLSFPFAAKHAKLGLAVMAGAAAPI